jgi:hypothetical protein
MNRPKKPKKANNLLKLISDEDCNSMSNMIMSDLKMGQRRSLGLGYSKDSNTYEEQKHTNDDMIIHEQDEGEDEIPNMCDDVPTLANIFHPYTKPQPIPNFGLKSIKFGQKCPYTMIKATLDTKGKPFIS